MYSFDPQFSHENLIAKNRIKGFSIYFLCLFCALTALFASPFIFIDVSSQARGFVRPAGENVPIISLVSGNIIEMRLKNNQLVDKGDTLLLVDAQSINSQLQLNNEFVQQTQLNIQDLEQMLSGGSNLEIHLPHNREDYQKYQSQEKELKTKLTAATQIYHRNKQLFHQSVIPLAEYERYESDRELAEEALQSYISQQKSQWQRQRKELLDANKNYNGTLQKMAIEKRNYLITSPISGTIINFKGYETKSFIGAATQLAEISPNEPLLVECQVSPRDIGLIKIGQLVRLQMDAFNYNQWGFLDAKVSEIDQHPVVQNQEVYFKVRAQLLGKQLKLKNGYTAQVQKGMSFTARFIISRRSLYQLLFDKIDQWLNPTVKPN